MKRITIKDIAKIAGVSYATVSRALGDSKEISTATRERILEICKEEGYYTNSLAKGLVNNKSYLLGLIVPDISNTFFSEMVLEIETYAKQNGYHLILCNSHHSKETAKEAFEFLMSHQADGIILVSTQPEILSIVEPFAKHVPIVIIGDLIPELTPICHRVSLDNSLGGKLAAQHLNKLGHQHVAYIGHRPHNSIHENRLSGFLQTAQHLNQSVTVIENTTSNSSSQQSGYQLAQSFLTKPHSNTAIFAATDSTALGILQAAEELGLSVPTDFSLIGFDNCSYTAYPGIALTTIDQCKKEQAQLSVQLLLDQMGEGSSLAIKTHTIMPKLCERKSCQTNNKKRVRI